MATIAEASKQSSLPGNPEGLAPRGYSASGGPGQTLPPADRQASLSDKIAAMEVALSKKLEQFIKEVQATGTELRALGERVDALKQQLKTLEERVGRV